MPDLVAVAAADRVIIAIAITVTACASPGQTPHHTRDRGFTVDHPPLGAYRALLDFMHCMRSHGMQMLAPVEWHGHSRLTAYYPLRNASSNASYRACDHFKHWRNRKADLTSRRGREPASAGLPRAALILRRMHMSRSWAVRSLAVGALLAG